MNPCVNLISSQEKVMMAVIQSGDYVRLLQMMDDGYAVTATVLEYFRCMRKHHILADIIKKFEDPEIVFSDSAADFVSAYLNEDYVTKIHNLRTQNERANRKAEVKKLLLVSGNKITPEVWKEVVRKRLFYELLDEVGLERIYNEARDIIVNPFYDLIITNQFLVEHKDVASLETRYHLCRYDEERCKFVLDVLTSDGNVDGAELLFAAKNSKLDEELVKCGKAKVFLHSNDEERYLRLFSAVQRYRNSLPRSKRYGWYLPFERYVEWYKAYPKQADEFIKEERNIVFRMVVKLAL